MKSLYKRIIAGVFAIVTLFFVCMPLAYALPALPTSPDVPAVPVSPALPDVEIDIDSDAVDFFTWLTDAATTGTNVLKSLIDDDVCGGPSGFAGRHNFVKQHTQVDGKIGQYYICEYCGKSAGEVGADAYQQQVSDLPATGYTSSGNLIWQPTISDLVDGQVFISSKPFVLPMTRGSNPKNTYDFNAQGNGFVHTYIYSSGGNSFSQTFTPTFVAPFSGIYVLMSGPCSSTVLCSSDGVSSNDSFSYTRGDLRHCNVGDTLESSAFTYITAPLHTVSAVASVIFPSYEVTLDTALSGSTYNANSRPTSITGGNYGIVGENGTINTVTNNSQIVNETNNTYYNPATGETKPILDWSYDYGDRTYTITVEGGDTYTVTYGDENISITENNVAEGDTIVNNYTIYYMIDGSGSDTPDPAPSPTPEPTPGPTLAPTPCVHTWAETSRTDPGCTSPGRVVYTCSNCGQTRTETLKALGHTWQVERTVNTTYDENGNVTQQGYTIYQCSVCGEQYKDADSTGPPGGSVNDGGLIEWLNGLIKSLSDNLSGAVELIVSFFENIPKLFGGFLEFLSAMFPYLPDDIIFLFTFGLAALVFIGIIKAMRR